MIASNNSFQKIEEMSHNIQNEGLRETREWGTQTIANKRGLVRRRVLKTGSPEMCRGRRGNNGDLHTRKHVSHSLF